MTTTQQSIFQNSYEICPIILTGGIAANTPSGMIPIIQLTDSADFNAGVISGNSQPLNDYFGHYKPMPGSTLIEDELGDYPFANQIIAANAIIVRPLKVSLLMSNPAQANGGYTNKQTIWTNLQNVLNAHNQLGGTYIVATPSFFYTNCILILLHDISRMDSNQAQNTWQWDFVQPLITQQAAQYANNSMMLKVASQVQSTGALSGPEVVTGATYPTGPIAPNLASITGTTISNSNIPFIFSLQ